MKPTTAKRIGTALAVLTYLVAAAAFFALGACVALSLSGCSSLPEEGVAFTVTASPSGISVVPAGGAEAEPAALSPSATPAGSADNQQPPTNQPEDSPDGVAFPSLSWRFGGFNGADASLSSPRIASLSAKASGLSFKWQNGLSSWGLADDDASAIAALFVQLPDGSWIGGKFDWISTSRSSRDFKNIYEGYNGWSLSGLANPCPACFVVVSRDGKLRSNVLGPVSWQHD